MFTVHSKKLLVILNLDSVCELSPKVWSHNVEKAQFIQEVNIKYGILLDYTVIEISDVPHWAETVQVLARSNAQQEVQPTQVPAPSPAEMPIFLSSTTASKCRI